MFSNEEDPGPTPPYTGRSWWRASWTTGARNILFFRKPPFDGDFTISIIANAPLSAFAQKLEDSERRRFNRTTLEFMNRLEEVMVCRQTLI